ncbi:hypothetical protein H4217_006929, partial [Coemansia sp. RSA 1939]
MALISINAKLCSRGRNSLSTLTELANKRSSMRNMHVIVVPAMNKQDAATSSGSGSSGRRELKQLVGYSQNRRIVVFPAGRSIKNAQIPLD